MQTLSDKLYIIPWIGITNLIVYSDFIQLLSPLLYSLPKKEVTYVATSVKPNVHWATCIRRQYHYTEIEIRFVSHFHLSLALLDRPSQGSVLSVPDSAL